MQNYQSITLDVNNCVDYVYVNAKQGDIDSRFLKITLTENGNKIIPTSKCTAAFRCLKPDGRICVGKSVINADGTITAALTEQVLASAGTVRADISLLDGKTVLSSSTFFIKVESSPSSEGSIVSSDEFLILVEKTNDAITAINSIDDAVDNLNSATRSIEDVKAYIGYTDHDILGLQVDYENKRFTRLAGAVGLNAGNDFDKFSMFGGRRRCNAEADGTITAFYGDEGFTITDNTVQVMVYQPAFYYKVVPIKMDKNTDGLGYHIRKANYYISDTAKAGFKLHPAFYDENGNAVEYILFSAYEGVYFKNYFPNSSNARYVTDALNSDTETDLEKDCILSYSTAKPISGLYKNLTRVNAEKLCSNFGQGWHCENIKALSANQLLMMIEFGMMNIQSAVEKGIVDIENIANRNSSANTGSTNNLGNDTGNAEISNFRFDAETEVFHGSENGKRAVSYRGMENPWGNIWKFINGINIFGNGNMQGGQPYIATDFSFAENTKGGNYKPVGFTIANEVGYANAMGYGNEEFDWLLLPSEIGGTSALPVGDAIRQISDLDGYRTLIQGGVWYYSTSAGPFCYMTQNGAGGKMYVIGCRTVYIPTAV